MNLPTSLYRILEYRMGILILWGGMIGFTLLLSFGKVPTDYSPQLLDRIPWAFLLFLFSQIYAWGTIWKAIRLTEPHAKITIPILLIYGSFLVQGCYEIFFVQMMKLEVLSIFLMLIGTIWLWLASKYILKLRNWFCISWGLTNAWMALGHISDAITDLDTAVEEWLSLWIFFLSILSHLSAYLATTIVLFRAYRHEQINPTGLVNLIDEIGQE